MVSTMGARGSGHALYYPYLQFGDESWVKTAALYYEGLTRIVPQDYETNDSETVRRLIDGCEFVRDHDPGYEADEIEDHFKRLSEEYLSDEEFSIPLMEGIRKHFPSGTRFNLLKDKLSLAITKYLDAKGDAYLFCNDNIFWVSVDAPIGALYMTCLANKISEKTGIPIVTDTPAYQPLIQGLQQDYYAPHTSDRGQAVASMVIETVVPKGIESVSVDQILDFRDDYRLERVRFYEAIEEIARDAPIINDSEALNDYVKQKATIVEANTRDLKQSLEEVNIDTANKLLAISTPALAQQLAPALVQQLALLVPQAAPIITAGLLCVGYGICRKHRARYKIKRQVPWSYVLYLERDLNKRGLLQKMLSI